MRCLPQEALALRIDSLLRPHTGNVQVNSVKARTCRDVKRLGVGATPVQVGHFFGELERPQMLALRLEDPEPAGARAIEVPFLVHFDAVGRAFLGVGS